MFGAECFDTYGNPIDHYTQWDVDQKLKMVLYGMDDGYVRNAPYVHFANVKSSEALVVRSTLQDSHTILVDIPNILLQESWPLLVYIYLNDTSDAHSQKTIIKVEIPVHKRVQPSDYEYVENIERITAEVIKQELYEEFVTDIGSGELALPSMHLIDSATGQKHKMMATNGKFSIFIDDSDGVDEYTVLDSRDKQEINNTITELSNSTQEKFNDVDTKFTSVNEELATKATVAELDTHNVAGDAHADIRGDITDVVGRIDILEEESGKMDATVESDGVVICEEPLVGSTPFEIKIKGNTQDGVSISELSLVVSSTQESSGGETVVIGLNGNELCSLDDGTYDELLIWHDGAVDIIKKTQVVEDALVALEEPETIHLPRIELPSLPSSPSYIWTVSNVNTGGLSVRYWLPNGELVAHLYDDNETGTTIESAIASHNTDSESHKDIRELVTAAHARADEAYTAAMAGGGSAAEGIEAHNTSQTAHQDIRNLIKTYTAGDGIAISDTNEISAKVDGVTVVVNDDTGIGIKYDMAKGIDKGDNGMIVRVDGTTVSYDELGHLTVIGGVGSFTPISNSEIERIWNET